MTQQNENNIPLPSHWKIAKLGEACEILDNKRIPINNKERQLRIEGKNEKELFPYYGATGQVGTIDDYLLEGEFVLLGEDGAPFLEPFKNKAYLVNGKIWVNNHAHILKANGSNKFLLHYLNQLNFREYVTGTTRLKLNQTSMKQIPIPLPSLPEQHRIVAKIEELFSELDNGVQNMKKAKEQLKIYRQAVLKHAFEGKFTEEWSKKRQKIKDKSKKGIQNTEYRLENDEVNIATEPELDFYGLQNTKLPDVWGIKAVADLFEIVTGTTPSKSKKEYYGNDIPFFKPTDLEQGINTRTSFDNLSKEGYEVSRKLAEKSVLVTCIGATIGKTGLIKKAGSCNQQINAILPNKLFVPEFVFYQVISNKFQNEIKSNASSTTLPILNKSKFEQLNFIIAPIEEQHQIVQEIETRFSVADKLEESINQSLQQAEALQQSILKKAFEGRLVEQEEEK